jgi:6-phosphogluconate dehydrogenase
MTAESTSAATTDEPVRARAQIGVVGLAVMGANLARNLAGHGYTVALYNRSPGRTSELVASHGTEGAFVPATTLAAFVASLERPRRILMMVKAGAATDATIESLVPYLEPGDILVDGGNSWYRDDIRRALALAPLVPQSR